MADGGIGEAALASALAGSAGAGEAAAVAAPAVADAGLLGGLGAGAAGELGATSSGIGAAGAAANPLSIGFTNAVSGLGSPTASNLAYNAVNPAPGALSRAGQVLNAGRMAGIGMPGMPGMGAPQGAAPVARPMGQPATPMSASQILGPPGGMPQGGSAGMVGSAMGGGANPQLMQLLMRLKQQGVM